MVFDGNFIDKAKAREWADRFSEENMTESEFQAIVAEWSTFNPQVGPESCEVWLTDEYRELRALLVGAWRSVEKGSLSQNAYYYRIDLTVGLSLYDFLRENGFNQIYSETDEWWRFVSIKLCPDLTYMRYPRDEKTGVRINRKRFFDHTRRIWLKTLWWYVHLGWQGDVDTTKRVLEKLGTDAISQMIERPGRAYRPDVFRVLAAKRAEEADWCDAKAFQKVMARHSIFNGSFEPSLYEKGIVGYANRIFGDTRKWSQQ